MQNLKPTNEVPKCKKWRKNRVKDMVEEMGEHGINGRLQLGFGDMDTEWTVSFADFDGDLLTQCVCISDFDDFGYEMVERCYMQTIKGRG